MRWSQGNVWNISFLQNTGSRQRPPTPSLGFVENNFWKRNVNEETEEMSSVPINRLKSFTFPFLFVHLNLLSGYHSDRLIESGSCVRGWRWRFGWRYIYRGGLVYGWGGPCHGAGAMKKTLHKTLLMSLTRKPLFLLTILFFWCNWLGYG